MEGEAAACQEHHILDLILVHSVVHREIETPDQPSSIDDHASEDA